MKNIISILASALIITGTATQAQDAWVDSYDSLLSKYVTSSGVKYESWHANSADMKALDGVVNSIAKQSLSGKSKYEKLAFYLNAYNANILDKILNDYPTDGPGGGGMLGRNRFFKSNNVIVAGKTTSFQALENETIRPGFNEPRIHFALNCASASCPPLNTTAFRAATLDITLESLTNNFINSNPRGVGKISKGKVAVSKLFDWYEDDFNAVGGALAFINAKRDTKLPNSTKVTFQDYSWKLNAAR